MKKVAFQGEKGAFSEAAAYHYWGEAVEPLPCRTFREVFESVTNKTSDFGIVPIENSFTGSIHQNMDLLLDFHLSVIGEIFLRIHHNLLVVPGAKISDIQKVHSHPQGLGQCSDFIEKHGWEAAPMYDTAGSAQWVAAQKNKSFAAIASVRAGEDYGLDILERNIENNDSNYTRFLVIAAEPVAPQTFAKTSIVFSTKDIPGALFKALSVFALRDINLLKIESRPLRQGSWQYWFYLDFEGSMQEEACVKAIGHLEEISSFVKILGSYEKGAVIE